MQQGLLTWRNTIMTRLQQIVEQYPKDSELSLETIADMFTATIEGGIILARNFENNALLANQILAYRAFLRMLFGAK
jgi:hypothetical protein